MLFQSAVPGVMADLFREAQNLSAAARKVETEKRLDFFHDRQLDHLNEQLGELYADTSKFTPATLNVVKKVILNLSQVYREEPKREIEGSDRDQKTFQEIMGGCSYGLKLKQASRYTKLLKTILLRPVWRSGRLDLDILTGGILDVEFGDSPEDLEGVLVTHYPRSGKADEITYSHWTAETFRRLNYRGQEIESEDNPYGTLPFIPCWDQLPTDDFWVPGGDDLVIVQEAINRALTDLLLTARFQGFGVPWVSGASSAGEQFEIGPGSMLSLGENDQIGFASPNAPIEEILGLISFLIKQVAVTNGLASASMSIETKPESGVSKVADRVELVEMRRDDVALWRTYEGRLFDLVRIVWNHHNPTRQISPKASLKIDFADPKPEISAKDQAQTWDTLVGLGVLSPVDIALERNPDFETRNDALAHLLKIQEETKAIQEGH